MQELATSGELSYIVRTTCHCTEAAARMRQHPVQIPESEARALRSTRIMVRLRAPSILSMIWEPQVKSNSAGR